MPSTSSVPSLVRLVSQLARSMSHAAGSPPACSIAVAHCSWNVPPSRSAPRRPPRLGLELVAKLGELLGADLVGLAAVLDVGVVLGDHEAAREVDRSGRRPRRSASTGPVELRDRVRVLGVALERAARGWPRSCRPASPSALDRGGQREVAAGDLRSSLLKVSSRTVCGSSLGARRRRRSRRSPAGIAQRERADGEAGFGYGSKLLVLLGFVLKGARSVAKYA